MLFRSKELVGDHTASNGKSELEPSFAQLQGHAFPPRPGELSMNCDIVTTSVEQFLASLIINSSSISTAVKSVLAL